MAVDQLPEGFVLDEPANDAPAPVETAAVSGAPETSSDAALPEGFVLDEPSTFTEAEAPVIDSKVKPGVLEGIKNDFIQGYAESAAGVNRKLAALTKIVSNPIIDTGYLSEGLAQNSKYWENVSKSAEEHAGGNWLIKMTAGAPIVGAEFAGAGPRFAGMVVGSGVLAALDEYGREVANNEKIQPGQIAWEATKGAGVMALGAGAFKGVGISLEKLGGLLPKYGTKIMTKTLLELGVPETEIPAMLKNMKSYLPGGKAYKKPEVLAQEQSAEIGAIKTANEELLWQQKNLGEGKQVKLEAERLRQETADKVAAIRDDNRTALEKLAEQRKNLQEDYRFAAQQLDLEARDTLVGAEAVQDAAVKKAEAELHEATGQVFGSLYDKLQMYKRNIDSRVQASLDDFYKAHPSEGVKVTEVGRNIQDAINAGRVLRAEYKDGVITVKPHGVDNQGLTQDARSLESWLNAFLSAEEDGAIRTLKNLHFNHQDISNLVGSKLGQGGVSTNVGDTVKLIKSALDPQKYLDRVSPNASQFFSGLKQELKQYGESKDLMQQWEALLFKTEGGQVVPNTKHLLDAMDRPTGKAFLNEVAKLESRSPEGLRILKDAQELKAAHDAIRNTQEDMLKRVKDGLSRSKKDREVAFRQAIKELNQKEAEFGSSAATRAMREQIREMQRQSSLEISTAHEAFAIRLRERQKELAAKVEAVTKTHLEDMNAAKAADIVRSFRPSQGMPRIFQNIGTYGAVGGIMTGMATGNLPIMAAGIGMKAGLAVATSPITIAKAFEWGIRNKEAIKAVSKSVEKSGEAVGKSKESRLLQQLLATAGSR